MAGRGRFGAVRNCLAQRRHRVLHADRHGRVNGPVDQAVAFSGDLGRLIGRPTTPLADAVAEALR